ncbi:neuroglian-like isoform X2 [Oppia nitens]|uniref:neuroglian-like isoform X2 n=1 Tax=Oppia nitens TaxID=1686743 RepID=UPI0023DA491A|nr:neuroglian-like isoform X2 [Oppia nitens]
MRQTILSGNFVSNTTRIYTLYIFLVIILEIIVNLVTDIQCVQSPPSMIKQPMLPEQLFQVAQSSDEVERPFALECEAKGDPEPTYRWIKNGLEFNYVAYDKRINQQPRRGTLVFTKPDGVDEGLYQCFAENKHGVSVSNSVFLRKSELNSFADEDFKEVFVNEGDHITLDCNPPTGYPKPSIFWIILSNTGALRSINSSRLTVDPEGRLHFSNVTKQDEFLDAKYACSATSIFRTEYKVGGKTILKVTPTGTSGQASHGPVVQYTSPPSVPALKDQRLELHCIFGGTPLPDIVWGKRGSNLEGSRFTFNNYGKSLVINKVDFSDEGVYECTASNGIGSQKSHAMEVKVSSAPYWIEYPNDTNAAEGETVSFKCIASGIPEPKLQWFVNGVPIEKAPHNNRRKVEGSVLIINDLIETVDTSVFQCNASNVHGYAFRDFYLNVLKLPPTITERPEPISRAVVSHDTLLRCRVFGAPKPIVKWEKDGQELTGGRYTVLDSGDLKIKDVLMTDAGSFKCKATNRFGDDDASGELEVKGRTKITHAPENFEVAARKMAVFRCNAEADSTLVLKIEWLFNGKKIDLDHDPRIVQAADNSLTITTTKELDSGVYTCVAKTDLDSVSSEATLTVQDVPNAPEIIGVECDVNTALVEWQPTGDRRAPILSYSIQFNTSFSPDNWEDAFVNIPAPDTKFKVAMSPWANYTFRVIARNKIGSSEPSGSSAMCSTQEEVPHRNPENVVGRGTAPDNLLIRWTPMSPIEHNGQNFFYKVYWKRNDISNVPWETKIIDNWREASFTIYNQPTFRPYRIKVEAHNRKGQAHIQATEVIGWSGEDKPMQPPMNFRLIEIRDAKSALFSWDPVSPDSVRGHFKGYKIQTWVADEDLKHMREVALPPNGTSAIVTVLKPYAKNYARIVVYNEAYISDYSNEIIVNTPEGVPGPVASFDGIPLGSNALYLFWTRPDEPNGILTGYRIFYEKVIGTALESRLERIPIIDDPLVTNARLAGLAPQTKYRVTILATTSKGMGEGFYIELTTKSEDAAEYPDKPSFEWYHRKGQDGKEELRIQWNPTTGNGKKPGSYFYVQYRLKGSERFLNTPKDENQDSTVVPIRGLEDDKTYEVRIVAVDGQYETPSETQEISASGPSGGNSTAHLANFAPWFIGMMCAIALIILLVVLVCIVKRNRGGKYSVHEKEAAQGREEYDEGGFNEYNKPLGGPGAAHHKGSRQSLNGSLQQAESDTDSMADYVEDDSSKFGEDGSFIGEYGPKKRRDEATTPMTGIATFV